MKRICTMLALMAVAVTPWVWNAPASAADSAGRAQVKVTYEDLARRLTDLTLLAVPPMPGERSGSRTSGDPASTYDDETGLYRNWSANGDAMGRIRDEGEDWVVFDQDGPGVIWRIWTGSCGAAHVKIYIDNASDPVVDIPMVELMQRYSFWGNSPNMSPVLSRGQNRLMPIPYTKHCKIVFCKGAAAYYQITYTSYPSGYEMPAYNNRIDRAYYAAFRDAERAFQERGEYPYPNRDQQRRHQSSAGIKPGETVDVYADKKPGAITMFRWDLSDIPDADRREVMAGLRLNVYWDGGDTPSIAAPLGAFFGSSPGYNAYRAYPMGMSSDGCYSYFYMPYRSARIAITNTLNRRIAPKISILSEPISAEKASSLMRFHAAWNDKGLWDGLDRRRFDEGGDRWPDWPAARIIGTGRFVGLALHVDNTWDTDDFPPAKWWEGENPEEWPLIDNYHWWGEGDEKFFVDGEKLPSTFGTGSEDYIGYSLAAVPPYVKFDSAYACQSLVPIRDNKGLTSVARFHVTDNIPFRKSFDAFMEKYRGETWKWDKTTGSCHFACTAYWYAMP